MVNLAANPSISGSTSNVSNLFNVAGPFTSVYSPALTAAPTQDFSIVINYPESTAAGLGTGVGNTPTGSSATTACATVPCQGLSFTYSGALDINDILYVGNTSTVSGTVPENILAFSSNGRLLGQTTNSATLKNAIGLSVDALGYGYFTTGSASATNNFAYFKTGGGSQGSLTGGGTLTLPTIKQVGTSFNAYGTAVDKANNVWVGGSGANLYEIAAGGTATPSTDTVNNVTVNSSMKSMGLQVDPNQNVWVAAGPTGSNITVLQNTGSIAMPLYTSGTNASGSSVVGPVGGITFAGSPYVAFIPGYNTVAGVDPFTPTFGTGVNVSSITAGTASAAGSLTGVDQLEADGTGVLFVTNYNNGSLDTMFFASGYGSATGYKTNPCVAATLNANTCSSLYNSGANSTSKPQWVAIDSTGSVWVGDFGNSNNTTGGALGQIIGAAAPTWPLLSIGKQGQTP